MQVSRSSCNKNVLNVKYAYTLCFSVISRITVYVFGGMAGFLPVDDDEQVNETKNNENTVDVTAILNGCRNAGCGWEG